MNWQETDYSRDSQVSQWQKAKHSRPAFYPTPLGKDGTKREERRSSIWQWKNGCIAEKRKQKCKHTTFPSREMCFSLCEYFLLFHRRENERENWWFLRRMRGCSCFRPIRPILEASTPRNYFWADAMLYGAFYRSVCRCRGKSLSWLVRFVFYCAALPALSKEKYGTHFGWWKEHVWLDVFFTSSGWARLLSRENCDVCWLMVGVMYADNFKFQMITCYGKKCKKVTCMHFNTVIRQTIS